MFWFIAPFDLFLEDAAEVEHDLGGVAGEVLEGGVGGEEGDDVGTLIGLTIVCEGVVLVARDVGLDDEELMLGMFTLYLLGMFTLYLLDDVYRGGFTQVVDVGLEGEAHQGDDWLATML